MLNYRRWNAPKPADIKERKAYLVGGGIASLAAAFYLMRDAGMPGENIHIIEKTGLNGGCLDGAGDPERGYILRGGRMFEEHYDATWDLFSHIPSLENPEKTVLDEVVEFNKEYVGSSKCRLVEGGKKANFEKYELNMRHLNEMNELLLTPEEDLADITIQQWFHPTFFKTNFWYFWATMFAFQPWHSVAEMRRYMIRFMHLVPGMNRIEGVLRTPLNQNEAMILPLQNYLKDRGVKFIMATKVVDVDFEEREDGKYATALHIENAHGKDVIKLGPKDIVFITNGSMVENSTYGDWDSVPVLDTSEGDVWRLWRNLARKDRVFGNPDKFASDIQKSKWESFTITFKGDRFFKKLEEFTGNRTGTGGLVTFKDSSWLMSIVAFRQPHFRNQPEDVYVLWGYGLFIDKEGDYVKKPMSQCTGKEIFEELLYQLRWLDEKEELMESVINVRTAMMPYITSQFMPRAVGDRPPVVPPGYKNIAFLGQFAEVPGECVFTVEYSVKSAMMAVYGTLGIDKVPPETYKGYRDVLVMLKAAETLLDDDKKEILKRNLVKYLTLL